MPNEPVYSVALMGNPNVGKSTVFNHLTGMHQHTGNWAGKTVGSALGECEYNGCRYRFTDLPGTYSLIPCSAEEAVARDHLCFSPPHAAVVVCDASCLERNLNLALQVMEICPRTLLCVNLLDEAQKKGVEIDFAALSAELGVPVVPMQARRGKGFDTLLFQLQSLCAAPPPKVHEIPLPQALHPAVQSLVQSLQPLYDAAAQSGTALPPCAFCAKRLLENDTAFAQKISSLFAKEAQAPLAQAAQQQAALYRAGITQNRIGDMLGAGTVIQSEGICCTCVKTKNGCEAGRKKTDVILDRIFTGRFTAVPCILLLLTLVLYITIQAANVPSQYLMGWFSSLEEPLRGWLAAIGAGGWVLRLLCDGIYRTVTWIVAVMLPPMAIFFPLFTLLEDFGFLPRVAFTMDKAFSRCGACGKQALTMCMGLGCNCVGVTGCRIIDSPKERKIAMLTNCFMPCNGRFGLLIALITVFFCGTGAALSRLYAAALLCAVILAGVGATFAVSGILSRTILKSEPSAFTLELPPYRTPQIGKVLVRSVLDRTLFVLGRAAVVAVPAGAVIWACANIRLGQVSLLQAVSGFLDPFARIFGLDGVILFAFILGFPANEIVLPTVFMAYLQSSSLCALPNYPALGALLQQNGWSAVTALCVMLFSLLHWPCSTTCITVYKETKSIKYTALAFFIPTLTAFAVCFAVNMLAKLGGALFA